MVTPVELATTPRMAENATVYVRAPKGGNERRAKAPTAGKRKKHPKMQCQETPRSTQKTPSSAKIKTIAKYLLGQTSVFGFLDDIPHTQRVSSTHSFTVLHTPGREYQLPRTLVDDASSLKKDQFCDIAICMALESNNFTSLASFCGERVGTNEVAASVYRKIRFVFDVPSWAAPLFRIGRPDLIRTVNALYMRLVCEAKSWWNISRFGQLGLDGPWELDLDTAKKVEEILRSMSAPAAEVSTVDKATISVDKERFLIRISARDHALLLLLCCWDHYEAVGRNIKQVQQAHDYLSSH